METSTEWMTLISIFTGLLASNFIINQVVMKPVEAALETKAKKD